MRGVAGTAHLITAVDKEGAWYGMAATAVSSVSMDPPSHSGLHQPQRRHLRADRRTRPVLRQRAGGRSSRSLRALRTARRPSHPVPSRRVAGPRRPTLSGRRPGRHLLRRRAARPATARTWSSSAMSATSCCRASDGQSAGLSRPQLRLACRDRLSSHNALIVRSADAGSAIAVDRATWHVDVASAIAVTCRDKNRRGTVHGSH